MPAPIRILTICVHNSARSQMAEAYIRKFAGDKVIVESAGLEPGEINPLVIEVMREDGTSLYGKKTNSVFDFFREGRLYDYVITVCNVVYRDQCPVFPGVTYRIHWDLEDPSRLTGNYEEKLGKVRGIRDMVRELAKQLVASLPDN